MTKSSYKHVPEGDPSASSLTAAHNRVMVALALGLVTGLLAEFYGLHKFSLLVGWDVAAAIWLLWIWMSLRGHTAEATANHAVREDPGRAAVDLLLVLASVGSLVAVGVLLLQAGHAKSTGELLAEGGFGLLSIVLSWAVVHVTFMLRYAREFYRLRGGIDFNGEHPPRYLDFAYMAFTLGMTFQVSDTAIEHADIRRTVLRHSLLSYVFGTVIIATTINLVAGLLNR